jgi:hypothetical protein
MDEDAFDAAAGAPGAGGDDAPSTSQQHGDQGYGYDGGAYDDLDGDTEAASDFHRLKKVGRVRMPPGAPPRARACRWPSAAASPRRAAAPPLHALTHAPRAAAAARRCSMSASRRRSWPMRATWWRACGSASSSRCGKAEDGRGPCRQQGGSAASAGRRAARAARRSQDAAGGSPAAAAAA